MNANKSLKGAWHRMWNALTHKEQAGCMATLIIVIAFIATSIVAGFLLYMARTGSLGYWVAFLLITLSLLANVLQWLAQG